MAPATDQAAPTGETAASCPYLATRDARDMEGNRVGLVTTFGPTPTTCRFYFRYGDHHAVLEIAPHRYASATDAFNAMVLMSRRGTEAFTAAFTPVPIVAYRVRFYEPDGAADWGCSFATGATMVSIRTDQINTSRDCVNVANAVAAAVVS